MILNNENFNQCVLYRGVNITCKSSFGYKYRVKRNFDQSLSSMEFLNNFTGQLNNYIVKQAFQLKVVDILAILSEIPLIVILLIFSATAKENQTLLITLSVVIIISSIIFIYFKISGILALCQRIQEFLDQRKNSLSTIGIKAIVIKSRCHDKAPEIFLNLLPEKLIADIEEAPTGQDQNAIHFYKDTNSDNDRIPLKKSDQIDDGNQELTINATSVILKKGQPAENNEEKKQQQQQNGHYRSNQSENTGIKPQQMQMRNII